MNLLLLNLKKMKRTVKIALLAFSLMLIGSLRNNLAAQPDYYPNGGGGGEVTYQTFYDQLSPYGQWVDYPNYGYVWVPDAGDDFRPYSTNGHWVYSDDYEWTWVSDYDWGWAPFHYGRWEEDANYGWFWVPGYEWAPAWVAWRDGGDYYGWAPLRPGINISVNFNIGSYNPPYDYWCFVPRRYISSPRIYDYYVDPRLNVSIFSNTTYININIGGGRYGYRTGPNRYEAERYCGRIEPVRFRDVYTPGRTFYRNNEVSFYRPQVRRESDRQFAPRQFERYDRNSGGFRNRTADGRTNDNGFRRNTDNGGARNGDNGGFRRNTDNGGIRTDDAGRRNVDNGGVRNGDNRNGDNGGFRRNADGGGRIDNSGDRRTPATDNGGVRNNDNNGFGRPDRRMDNSGGQRVDPRMNQPAPRTDMPNRDIRTNDNNGGRFDRRSSDPGVDQRDRRVAPDQQRNYQPAPVQPRQEDRRVYQQPVQNTQPRQEQPRTFERRSAEQPAPRERADNRGGGNENRGNGNGNGNGNDKGDRGFRRR